MNVEIGPSTELYEGEFPRDYFASLFQGRKGYLNNLISKLKTRGKKGYTKLLECRRLGFGSLIIEGCNLFFWKKK